MIVVKAWPESSKVHGDKADSSEGGEEMSGGRGKERQGHGGVQVAQELPLCAFVPPWGSCQVLGIAGSF